jgi:hypothetical protein
LCGRHHRILRPRLTRWRVSTADWDHRPNGVEGVQGQRETYALILDIRRADGAHILKRPTIGEARKETVDGRPQQADAGAADRIGRRLLAGEAVNISAIYEGGDVDGFPVADRLTAKARRLAEQRN